MIKVVTSDTNDYVEKSEESQNELKSNKTKQANVNSKLIC
jgi:hypothetical protein